MIKEDKPTMQDADGVLANLIDDVARQQRNNIVNLLESVVELEEKLSCCVELKNSILVNHKDGAQYEFYIGIKNVKANESDEDFEDELG